MKHYCDSIAGSTSFLSWWTPGVPSMHKEQDRGRNSRPNLCDLRSRTARVPVRKAVPRPRRLPEKLKWLFWEYEFRQLSWANDRDLVITRILVGGPWEAIHWLRRRLGDEELRLWIMRSKGAGLSPRQLRFWELILAIPRRRVNQWLATKARATWDNRRQA